MSDPEVEITRLRLQTSCLGWTSNWILCLKLCTPFDYIPNLHYGNEHDDIFHSPLCMKLWLMALFSQRLCVTEKVPHTEISIIDLHISVLWSWRVASYFIFLMNRSSINMSLLFWSCVSNIQSIINQWTRAIPLKINGAICIQGQISIAYMTNMTPHYEIAEIHQYFMNRQTFVPSLIISLQWVMASLLFFINQSNSTGN